jgi:NAD kinase|tara:strand:+ start:926 stop:1213 length:288 start_codon:yes stop_codon:yes gene_type:complete
MNILKMAKKIKTYSKMDNNEKKHINTLITNGELKVIDINSEKKGVLMNIEEDEFLIILDHLNKIDSTKEEKFDTYIEEIEEDIELEENVENPKKI